MSVAPTDERPVPGFPGYTATADGRVFSTRPWRGSTARRELAGGIAGSGYRHIVLCDGSHRRTREVHVIIAETFHGPRPKGMDVRHLDGDKTNNAASNLRYGTRTQNHLDSVAHGTHSNARKTHCPANHAYDDANTYVVPKTGDRTCRRCASDRARRAA